MVLIAVLFFIVLLVSGVATFLRRATLDGMIALNRDLSSRSEALARGGVQLATALLLQDRLDEQLALPLEEREDEEGEPPRQQRGNPEANEFRSETRGDLWARIGEVEIAVPDGGRLRLRIEDAGSRLNLNGLLDEEGKVPESAKIFLTAFLDKVIGEMPVREEEKNYDTGDLAQNLLDYIDENSFEESGGEPEDDYYQLQSPPYRAANRPLLSIDELGLVEGFDRALVDAIRPYATVYPYLGGGINPNTAPSHVLAALYHGTAGDERLASQEEVERILEMREGGEILCDPTAAHAEAEDLACTPIGESGLGPGFFPPLTYTADVFQVSAEASYGEVRRTVEAVIDRSDATQPLVLSWRLR